MSDRPQIPLLPVLITIGSPEYGTISSWPFVNSFVARLLRDDLPERVRSNQTRIWVYCDPDDQLVGFGTLDVCQDYREYTQGSPHPYVPLLAVNPAFERRGHGTSIVQHLIGESAVLIRRAGCARDVYLDVYQKSVDAIKLYEKSGFVKIIDKAFPDPLERGLSYFVMARQVIVERGVPFSITGR